MYITVVLDVLFSVPSRRKKRSGINRPCVEQNECKKVKKIRRRHALVRVKIQEKKKTKSCIFSLKGKRLKHLAFVDSYRVLLLLLLLLVGCPHLTRVSLDHLGFPGLLLLMDRGLVAYRRQQALIR